jgi:pyruvate,water dikinase
MRSSSTSRTPSGDLLRHRYRVLRRLLAGNSELLEVMADLEADLAYLDPGEQAVRQPVLRLLDGSLLLAENLNILSGGAHTALYAAHEAIAREIRSRLRSTPDPAALPLMVPLEDASPARAREVGGKAANLGPLRAVAPAAVPQGFAITTAAYRRFLSENRLNEPIRRLSKDLSLITHSDLFRERTTAIRALIEASPVPRRIAEALHAGVQLFGETPPGRWAVRSSAVGEDAGMTFAGQFDSLLGVATGDLAGAYRTVVASRFNDHAVLYRLAGGFSEVETPMAVLVIPMVDARAAGVLYSRDPREMGADRMLVDAVPGLADAMVRGQARAASVHALRSRPGETEGEGAAAASPEGGPAEDLPFPLAPQELRELVELGLLLEAHCGHPIDVEWVLARDGALKVVQCRPLHRADGDAPASGPQEARQPLAAGGFTIFPGRAVGPVHLARSADELASAPDGAVLVVQQAGPELAAVLPRVAGVIAEQGNPAGHAAALVRDFAVPSLFGFAGALGRLGRRHTVSLDASQRLVFEGSLWPEVVERVRRRIRRPPRRAANPLHDLVLALNLTNPMSSSFRASACLSLHDVVRYAHEKAVAAMFDLGGEVERRGERRLYRLESPVQVALEVLDLGGAIPAPAADRPTVRPEEIASAPFRALWRGMTLPGVSWAGRTQVGVAGFLSVMATAMTGPDADRGLGAPNYVMVAPDYVNLNARLAYHFAMVDAFVSPVPENNFVNFRFRGGGAAPERRDLRARFLAEVLLGAGFAVDRRGDLVTAWLRRYPSPASEEGLATLGALMGCARQLDMLIADEAAIRHYAERFAAGDYGAFG